MLYFVLDHFLISIVGAAAAQKLGETPTKAQNDNKSISENSLQNVIHSATFPQLDKNKWTTSIDFGSAPIEAFKELVMILSKQGISKVEVHSQSFRRS